MNASKAAAAASEPTKECCMCGDLGLFSELFRCKSCKFRFQHKYCSNEYPKADVYKACNWCLMSAKDDSGEKTQNSINSSSSNKTITSGEDVRHKKKINGTNGGLKSYKKPLKAQTNQMMITKKVSPDRSPVLPMLTPRKRITTTKDGGGNLQEKLRRTKSLDVSNRGILRTQTFRNKVRRYKLLDEVSC